MNKHTDIESPQWLSLDLLEENKGQLFGLPANPREIAPEKFELLKADIQKYPQFLQYNALKVYPLDNGHYIVIGGNMRCRALKELGFKEVPCIIIPQETHVEELKAYIILDNSNFGRWDWPALTSEEWNSVQLQEWGVDIPLMDDDGYDWDNIADIESNPDAPNFNKKKIVVEVTEDGIANYDTLKSEIEELVRDYSGASVK